MTTKTKPAAKIAMHADVYGNAHLPAVNVKVYRVDWPSAAELAAESGCSEAHANKVLEMVWEVAVEEFWVAAEQYAVDIFGPEAKVYSQGRSGGWCAVEGLPKDVATWPLTLRRQWARFEQALKKEIKCRKSAEWAQELITANDWLTPRPTDADIIAELSAALTEMLNDAEIMREPYRNEATCERARAALAKVKNRT